MSQETTRLDLRNPSLKVKIVGVGGAGLSSLAHAATTDLNGYSLTVVDTDSRSLADCAIAEKVLIGACLTHGLGTGGDPALGKAAVEDATPRMMDVFTGTDLVFVVLGLGGGTGAGAGPVICRIAKESGALVVGIATTPFEFEGLRRANQAQAGFHELKTAADAVICLPNQKLFRLIDEKTSVVEAFGIANDLLAQGVRGMLQMLTRGGLIRVDFADLCSVLRGRHVESLFATATAEGEKRAREVVDRLLASPLLAGANCMAGADSILVSLVGGSDLTMGEVNRIMDQINRHCEQATVVMGAAIDPAFAGRIEVTLIVSRRRMDAPDQAPRSEEEEESGIDTEFFKAAELPRPASRFIAPPPELTPERAKRLLQQQGAGRRKQHNAAIRLLQGQLPLEIISKGRFERSEPTLHDGQDLDVPTYIRRGVPLN